MTGTEIALLISACGTFVTAIAAFYGVIVSQRNSKKIAQVIHTTNSLVQRNEAIAYRRGLAEGAAAERAKREGHE